MSKKKRKKLGPYEFRCVKCGKVESKSSYCVAQQTMGHVIIFTCQCGTKQYVPD